VAARANTRADPVVIIAMARACPAAREGIKTNVSRSTQDAIRKSKRGT
jgi:hypothetical protein